jgi:serine/threonine-protein kinase RsbW
MPEELSIRIAAHEPDIDTLLDQLEAFFEAHDLPMTLLQTFSLAFDEVVTNIASYGYPEGTEARGIDIHLRLSGDEIRVEIVDDGIAFDPLQQAEPDTAASLDDREIGGLGIFLVRKLMDSVAYQRNDERNHLVFTKQLPART